MISKITALALSFACLSLGGCATTAFNAPVWPCKFDSATRKCNGDAAMNARKASQVDGYLRANIAKYDQLISDAETGKVVTEVPIILAAVGGATAVALGANTDVAIGAAGIGALGSGMSNWIKPRERQGYVVQARSATTCILREHTQLAADAVAASLATYDATNDREYTTGSNATTYVNASAQVENAGNLALAASDEIVSKLKTRLAGIGSAPDYGAIIEDLRRKQE